MARQRKTKAQREKEALAEFERLLRLLPDPRRKQGQRYPLFTVVCIALMGMICGCDDAEALGHWGRVHQAWLKKMLPMPHGAPSQDVFLAVFAALDAKAFNLVFVAWVELLKVRIQAEGKHVAIDGKTSRRSHDAANGKPALHTVSAWLSQEGVVLGQIKTEDKTNEIKAIPELLDMIDIRGATVTIDAMGCQTEIAKKIIEKNGNYLLAVKGNQPTLHEDIKVTFEYALEITPLPIDAQPRPALERFEETDKEHGRIEQRTTYVCRDFSQLRSASDWPHIGYIAMAITTSTNMSTGKKSRDVRYFIGSESVLNAKNIASAIRRHWGIENSLHWVLDIAFREDEARQRVGNCAANFTTLRHFALNLVKTVPGRKVGVANTRKLAGWHREVLVSILLGQKI